jgi:DNA-binding CsgD family transcriptional regulator
MTATGHSGARTARTGDLAGPVPVYVACVDGVTASIVVGALEREGLNVSTQWGPLADVPGQARVVVVWEPENAAHPDAWYTAIRGAVPDAAVVVVCSPERETPQQLLWAGADGVVVEPGADAVIGAAVRAVLAGYLFYPKTLRSVVRPPPLSARERQLIELVAEGLTNREIAQRLFLAESTVKRHLSRSFRRLGVRSRGEAAALLALQAKSGDTT